ncbi:MAG TPA: 2'-5' RNA ligase family protein [Pseudonocardiaceae bacterium]|nr:2'-5' RNA ligase family protein [Pseudonocardiaceae bacterium]
MAQVLAGYFDDDADQAVRALRQRLVQAGIPTLNDRPHLTFAAAGAIPPAARKNLAADLAMLAMPNLWLYVLGTFPAGENALILGAVTDAELLAVHVAMHDSLAGRARDPWAHYLPGAWVPHCTLAQDITPSQLAAGFAAAHPIEPIRARITEVSIKDTRTGVEETLLSRDS